VNRYVNTLPGLSTPETKYAAPLRLSCVTVCGALSTSMTQATSVPTGIVIEVEAGQCTITAEGSKVLVVEAVVVVVGMARLQTKACACVQTPSFHCPAVPLSPMRKQSGPDPRRSLGSPGENRQEGGFELWMHVAGFGLKWLAEILKMSKLVPSLHCQMNGAT